MEDFVSVIMPVYNAQRTVEIAVESVLAQSYSLFELIIVDDISTDKTIQIVKEIAKSDKRLCIYSLSEKGYAYGARNYGINRAVGTHIAFIDADDLWLPDKLEKQLQFMKARKIKFSFHGYTAIDNSGSVLYSVAVPDVIKFEEYLKNTVIGCSTVMLLNSNALGKLEFPTLRTSQDMALWLTLLRRGVLAYGLKDNLTMYRVHDNSTTSNKFRSSLSVLKVYRFHGIGRLRSVYYWFHFVKNAVLKRLISRDEE